ncbi:MAG TPA: acyl-CoA thioester hydrolase/BAAT C-terminal domain-containing protein [Rhizomicrobium sp.]
MRRLILLVAAAALAPALAAAQTAPSPPPATPSIAVGDPGPGGVRIDKDGVFANFFAAGTPGRAAAVLLLGGSEGGLNPGGGGMIKGLSDAGFSVLYLCYFGCPGTPPQMANVPLETFDRALAFLRAQPGIDPDRIAVVGGSKGSEAALLLGTRDRRLKAVVAAMPSSVAWPGSSAATAMQSSWSVGGAPLPFLPYAFASFGKSGIFGLYNDALPTLPQHPEAAIAVEQIAGPILLVCGEADTLWPSCPMADQISARLQAKGRPAPVLLRYRDAGHGVFGTPVAKLDPNYAGLAHFGGSADGNAAARAEVWPKTIAFLKAALHP